MVSVKRMSSSTSMPLTAEKGRSSISMSSEAVGGFRQHIAASVCQGVGEGKRDRLHGRRGVKGSGPQIIDKRNRVARVSEVKLVKVNDSNPECVYVSNRK